MSECIAIQLLIFGTIQIIENAILRSYFRYYLSLISFLSNVPHFSIWTREINIELNIVFEVGRIPLVHKPKIIWNKS